MGRLAIIVSVVLFALAFFFILFKVGDARDVELFVYSGLAFFAAGHVA